MLQVADVRVYRWQVPIARSGGAALEAVRAYLAARSSPNPERRLRSRLTLGVEPGLVGCVGGV